MVGTILNVITVAIGSTLGLLIGDRLPERTQESVVTILGLVTIVVAIDNASQSGNIIIPVISLIIGTFIGEAMNLQQQLDDLGGRLQQASTRYLKSDSEADSNTERERFINGFVTASLVFCVGPLTFVGSIQDGISGDYELLAIKSVLDGFASLAFAASFGIGVMFSIVTIIVIQGGLTIAGILAGDIMSTAMIDEMTATGGIILLALGLVILDVKKPRVANYLPALLIAPLLVAIASLLGIDIYPNL